MRISLILIALLGYAGIAPAANLTVDNYKGGETQRYPVALVRGSADGGPTVHVRNRDNKHKDGKNSVPVENGAFKVLVELVPGRNRLELTCGKDRQAVDVTYTPATTDRKVNIIYLTAEDGKTRYITQKAQDSQKYRDKLDTAAKLMQTFTAERMNDIGLGRTTFALDFNASGRVNVHTLAYPAARETLLQKDGNELYGTFYDWIDRRFPMNRWKNVVVMGFTDYDPATRTVRGHTALGGGGMGLFSSNALGSWPDSIRDTHRAFSDVTPVDTAKIWDDSAFRGTLWGLAATTIGATLHEMGHTFGLPHTEDPQSIMSRGFDHFNRAFSIIEPPSRNRQSSYAFTENEIAYWDPVFARRLAVHPWFQPDITAASLYLTRWKFSPEPVSWQGRPAAPALGPDDVERISASLRGRPVEPPIGDARLREDGVDLLKRYGAKENVLAYALAEVNTETGRSLKITAGGDDGIRVWLNGRLVIDHPGLEVTGPDTYDSTITVKPGANEILVESAQGPGNWYFAIRLLTPEGATLIPDASGRLE